MFVGWEGGIKFIRMSFCKQSDTVEKIKMYEKKDLHMIQNLTMQPRDIES